MDFFDLERYDRFRVVESHDSTQEQFVVFRVLFDNTCECCNNLVSWIHQQDKPIIPDIKFARELAFRASFEMGNQCLPVLEDFTAVVTAERLVL